MRKLFFLSLGLISFVFFLFITETAHTYPVPVTLNQHIGFADGPGTTNGGEFRVYDWSTKEELFRSFCLETNEYLSFGKEFIVAGISDSAKNGGSGGPSPDPISDETAYLYHHFYWGTLPDYKYQDTSTSQYFTSRDQSANALQRAIWWFENETGGQENHYTALAKSAVNSPTWPGIDDVRVINLTDVNGNRMQDQLTVVPAPEPATILLLGSGVIGLFAFGKRRSWKLPPMK